MFCYFNLLNIDFDKITTLFEAIAGKNWTDLKHKYELFSASR